MKKIIFALMIGFVCFNIGLAQSSKVTAQEKNDLFQLILKNDKKISENVNNADTDKMAKAMSVEKIDLNKDGQAEYIVVMDNGERNTPLLVYQKTAGEYKLLLRSFGQMLTQLKTSTKKFRDLRGEGSNSSSERGFDIFKFDGDKYQATKCYTETYQGNGKKVKTTITKCEEPYM